MSWTKHFSPINSTTHIEKWIERQNKGNNSKVKYTKTNSWLPEVYEGSTDRLERYAQYDDMDTDPIVNACLDTIADFCTQKDPNTNLNFDIQFNGELSQSESNVLNAMLRKWHNLNQFDKRLWRIVRCTFKFGDQIFIRDPETFKLMWCDASDIEKIVVDLSNGKKIEEYFLRNIDLNLESLVATNQKNKSRQNRAAGIPPAVPHGATGTSNAALMGAIPANGVSSAHILHLSLTEGIDGDWPFGRSILEAVYKPFKQKTLLEDAILIYRVHRAPERRVFYIDTGEMPPNRAMSYVERVKNEIQQRRIPSNNGGQKTMDTTYNPMSMTEDYFFAQGTNSRGSRVETLPGGESTGNIEDLRFFNDQLMFGLRVPRSYLPNQGNDTSSVFSDGKTMTALIEEKRFSVYCERLQSMLNSSFDREFKLFLKHHDNDIDSTLYNIKLATPINFTKYRQAELDASLLQVFGQVQDIPFISKRFAMKRYLGMSEDEILDNERMWKEENSNTLPSAENNSKSSGLGLDSVGINPTTDIGSDFEEPADGDEISGFGADGSSPSPISGDNTPEGQL